MFHAFFFNFNRKSWLNHCFLISCRPWPCVHCLPTSRDPPSVASSLVRVLLFHDHLVRNRRSGQLQPSWCFLQCFNALCHDNNLFSIVPQFVGLESIITSLSDIYPSYVRKGYHRELILLLMCALSFIFGLFLVSGVSFKTFVAICRHMSNSALERY